MKDLREIYVESAGKYLRQIDDEALSYEYILIWQDGIDRNYDGFILPEIKR